MKYASLALALCLAGCGYVGDPLPPALKIPTPVNDLSVRQVGGKLLVQFTIPEKTTDDLPLEKLGGLELKIGDNITPFNADTWSAAAKIADVTAKEPGKVETGIPAAEWAGKEVVVGVRVANAKMRISPWSNFVTLKVTPVLVTPSGVRAVATAAGILIDWTNATPRPGVQWKVFRQGASDKEPVELGKTAEPKFIDAGAGYDEPLKYTVQAFEEAGLSELSEPLTITAVDIFAPAPPQGLSVLAGPSATQLSWERNQEPDMASYRIYRALGDAALEKIADSPSAANYRDAAIRAGQRYRYAVTALDKKGNESPKSEIVEISIP